LIIALPGLQFAKTFLFPFSLLMAVQAADCRLMTADFLNLSFSFWQKKAAFNL
jgi:hypothetical protein